VYGISTSVISIANAIAPMIGAGLAVWVGLRAIFVVAAVIYLVAALFVARLMSPTAVVEEK